MQGDEQIEIRDDDADTQLERLARVHSRDERHFEHLVYDHLTPAATFAIVALVVALVLGAMWSEPPFQFTVVCGLILIWNGGSQTIDITRRSIEWEAAHLKAGLLALHERLDHSQELPVEAEYHSDLFPEVQKNILLRYAGRLEDGQSAEGRVHWGTRYLDRCLQAYYSQGEFETRRSWLRRHPAHTSPRYTWILSRVSVVYFITLVALGFRLTDGAFAGPVGTMLASTPIRFGMTTMASAFALVALTMVIVNRRSIHVREKRRIRDAARAAGVTENVIDTLASSLELRKVLKQRGLLLMPSAGGKELCVAREGHAVLRARVGQSAWEVYAFVGGPWVEDLLQVHAEATGVPGTSQSPRAS